MQNVYDFCHLPTPNATLTRHGYHAVLRTQKFDSHLKIAPGQSLCRVRVSDGSFEGIVDVSWTQDSIRLVIELLYRNRSIIARLTVSIRHTTANLLNVRGQENGENEAQKHGHCQRGYFAKAVPLDALPQKGTKTEAD